MWRTMDMVSDNIKMLRRRYSLTQEQLGAIAGVSDKAVSTWENGVAEPRIGAVRKMSEYFGIKVSDILESGEHELNNPEASGIMYVKVVSDNPSYRKALDVIQKKPELADLVCELGTVTGEDMVLIESLVKKLAGKKHK